MSLRLEMKGLPVAVVQTGNIVTLWVSSPTGDSSDSHLFPIHCLSNEQAEQVFAGWQSLILA